MRLVWRHNRVVLLVHIVWATMKRQAVLPVEADGWLREVLRRRGAGDGFEVLACGNAADHVHAVARYPATLDVAFLAKSLKGGSSWAWNRTRRWPHLTWQEGYWAQSVDPDALPALAHYIDEQRHHHLHAPDREPWE